MSIKPDATMRDVARAIADSNEDEAVCFSSEHGLIVHDVRDECVICADLHDDHEDDQA